MYTHLSEWHAPACSRAVSTSAGGGFEQTGRMTNIDLLLSLSHHTKPCLPLLLCLRGSRAHLPNQTDLTSLIQCLSSQRATSAAPPLDLCRSALEGVARGPAAPDWLRHLTDMQGAPTSSGHLQAAVLGAGRGGGAGGGVVGADALLDVDLGELVGRLKAEERAKMRRREGRKKRKKGKRRREKGKERERSGKAQRSSQRRRNSGSSGSTGSGSDSSEDNRGKER